MWRAPLPSVGSRPPAWPGQHRVGTHQLLCPPAHPGLSWAGGWPSPAPRGWSAVARSSAGFLPCAWSSPRHRGYRADRDRFPAFGEQLCSFQHRHDKLAMSHGQQSSLGNGVTCRAQSAGTDTRHPPGTATSGVPRRDPRRDPRVQRQHPKGALPPQTSSLEPAPGC